MFRKRKFVCFLLLVFFLIAGCSAVPESKSIQNEETKPLNWDQSVSSLKGETITVLWTGDPQRKKSLRLFSKKTGIKVKEISVDYNSLYNKITVAALSNSSDIDVIEMDNIWGGQFYEGNIVTDLTNVIPKDYLDKFTKSSVESMSYDNHVLGIPLYSSTKHFYWNKELLRKANITSAPKTWKEFKEDSKKLKEKGIYASGWSWKQAESLVSDYVTLLYAFDGRFFDKAGKPVFNQGGGLKALQYMVDLLNKDKTVSPASLQWTESDVENAFSSGKIAMMTNWEGIYPEVNDPKKSSVVGKTDVGLIPGQGKVKSAAVTGTAGVAIAKNSKNKAAALAFLKFIGSKEFQVPYYLKAGWYPSLETAYKDSELLKADTIGKLNKIKEQYKYGVDRPNAPGYVNWSDILAAELHAALRQQKTPKEALNSAVKKIEEAIKGNS
ncbi:carbohydrate ABC transporter substrate-binding protein (CUT1 family) [Scopulibacillus darangshiensis]|uniref:Carbohydrate ABC transporter substrate-binding protein (CUT1 family) n=1 Tax=Scopulibacillus darangshiensis TaxID=442528 RepID=A0A4R2P7P1_9BACL|nr:sugar ABC transporter substrate-binding protein [Scopulibacillus darangshiensis]TCP30969.1 carbohydrate ABC transporter substrate-binding protein (CUT1 family) [Scopulibacillus darangshiensis]